MSPQLVDDGRHGAEHLGLSGSGDVALVVDEDGVQQRRNKVLSYLENNRRDQQPATEEEMGASTFTDRRREDD